MAPVAGRRARAQSSRSVGVVQLGLMPAPFFDLAQAAVTPLLR